MGEARLGDAPLTIVAVRVKPEFRQAPDYKGDADASGFETDMLATMLEEIEFLTEMSVPTEQSIVELEAGRYVLCVLPAKKAGAAEFSRTAGRNRYTTKTFPRSRVSCQTPCRGVNRFQEASEIQSRSA